MRLIDTSIAVDHLRGVAAATELLSGLIQSGEPIAASELVRFELLAGVQEGELETLEQFFSALSWVSIDAHISEVGGLLARRYRRSHSGIDDTDYLIAATALVLDVGLVTTNLRHFPMLPGLESPY
ncbi:MAG: type II toxin-antitoxin system VapC family toxin [Actinobacteria bacterium]|nr:type II toxin-antitoxin system VapC family toxin [Actinomycetota bacterium]